MATPILLGRGVAGCCPDSDDLPGGDHCSMEELGHYYLYVITLGSPIGSPIAMFSSSPRVKLWNSPVACLLVIAALFSQVDGILTLPAMQPTACTSSTFPYKTTVTVDVDSFGVEFPELRPGSKWKFTAESGIQILAITAGGGRSATRGVQNSDGSFTLTTNGDTGSPPVMGSAKTLPNHALTKFKLTIANGAVPCILPIIQDCSVTGKIDVNPSQWAAYRVDEFLESYVKNWTAKGGKNFMQDYFQEFLGNSRQYSCKVDDESQCNFPFRCDDIVPGPYRNQAYLALGGLENLSRLLHLTWAGFNKAGDDVSHILPTFSKVWTDLPKGTASWQMILAIFSSILTAFALPFIGIPSIIGGEVMVASFIGGSTAFGLSGNVGNAAAASQNAASKEFRFDNYADQELALGQYVHTAQEVLYATHDAFFQSGTNLTKILSGGKLVQTELVDKSLLNNAGESSAPSATAVYLEHVFITRLLNEIFLQKGVFIKLIPYGLVTALDGQKQLFTKQECENDWAGDKNWSKDLIITCNAGVNRQNGVPAGMAFMSGGYDSFGNPTRPDWYKRDFTFNNYKYDIMDVIHSSVSSFTGHGFKYNATDDAAKKIAAGQHVADLQDWAPSDAGTFNLPVCSVADLGVIPYCDKKVNVYQHLEWCMRLKKSEHCDCLTDSVTGKLGDKTIFFRDALTEPNLKRYKEFCHLNQE
ncbi:uncharacterized protein BP5553_10609 [Venustampulla echinocandica]|uniref:Uncharacterized protein n=1 Tax=Venustampulla echinocandica TaxID=2656787 RepID=A0A370T913_9HELO|nr:uncharacterized protein BP5553_10609 [Venustampulla echinocandica]RDL29982.1 hypothetical protein BP5553_10609 [Venustampulla echinocandica]